MLVGNDPAEAATVEEVSDPRIHPRTTNHAKRQTHKHAPCVAAASRSVQATDKGGMSLMATERTKTFIHIRTGTVTSSNGMSRRLHQRPLPAVKSPAECALFSAVLCAFIHADSS